MPDVNDQAGSPKAIARILARHFHAVFDGTSRKFAGAMSESEASSVRIGIGVSVQLVGSARMRMAGLPAVLLLAVAVTGSSASGEEQRGRFRVFDNGPGEMAALYADRPSIVADYAAAMSRYRMVAEVADFKPLAYPFLSSRSVIAKEPWTWMAPDGSVVRRLRIGLFRINAADSLGNWFTDIECVDAGWPVFECSDGRTRRMSAPDGETMIFGGVEYKRELSQPAAKDGAVPQEKEND
ncbi:hypothetical protein [Chelativorans salis]|uniref:DUF2314 domain-containing protein n=1 Tax=Chelativorans salis TaxID=2978478 RepID=A0ABT2LU59_9HYPH|nr:hypothetical protein [Chelativorans sp. EGI FJ00035]MCT7378052.1 hypothetical protein [Chelativorans sp. EGI FJ00035]